ncbi:hypothetical protein Tco_0523260 [Tanacetum coccineum]
MDEELARKLEEEEKAKFNAEQEARSLEESKKERVNLEGAEELQRQLDPISEAQAKKNMIVYLKNQGGYKIEYFKGMSYEDIRPIFEKVWKQVQYFRPMDSEREKESEKTAEESQKKAGGSGRKKSLGRKRGRKTNAEASYKKQKQDKDEGYEQEKQELRLWFKIVPDEEEDINPEVLSAKYPIVDWEYLLLGRMEAKDMKVYKITRVDKSASYYGEIQDFLRRLGRQDLSDLYRLAQERFNDHPLEGKELVLWGDLSMIFDPNAEDDIWMN